MNANQSHHTDDNPYQASDSPPPPAGDLRATGDKLWQVASYQRGVIICILTLIPLVGLIVLLVVNHKATKLLRNYGVKVGLLGANPSDI